MNSESFPDKKDNFITQFEDCIKNSKNSGTIEMSFKRGKINRKFQKHKKS